MQKQQRRDSEIDSIESFVNGLVLQTFTFLFSMALRHDDRWFDTPGL